ncbi:MAG: diguanylate cyclase [Meiothermus silvanus]|nr:diguanylate cyclase [Allomeiothermus silvanus]
MSGVSFEGVTKRFGDVVAVADLNLEVLDHEFLVLLADLPDDRGPTPPEVIRTVAGRIAASLADAIPVRDRLVHTTASIGAALFPAEADDADELMRLADAAMYAHKRRVDVGREPSSRGLRPPPADVVEAPLKRIPDFHLIPPPCSKKKAPQD